MRKFIPTVFNKNLRHILRLEVVSVLLLILSASLFMLALKPKLLLSLKMSRVSASEMAENVLTQCRGKLSWRDCYGRQIARLNYQMDFEEALEIMKKVGEIDGRARDCHLISHHVAASEVDKAPEDWIKIFDYVDQTTCNNGFVHGVMEGRSKYDSGLVLDEKTIPDICSQIEARTSARVGKTREGADDACAHIIGHILLAQEDAVIKNAVEICGKIPSDIKRGCFDGVFMENITRENLEAHAVAQKFELTKEASFDLEENCRQYSGSAGLSCWRELAHIYTSITGNDPVEVYPLCYQSENEEYARDCYMHSVNLMILSDNYSEQNLADTCKEYWETENESKSCISRSLTPLLGSSVEFIDRAVVFCQSAPTEYMQFCYTKIGQELKSRTSQERRVELCQKVPEDYYNYCMLKS